jgi:hypothetical protein
MLFEKGSYSVHEPPMSWILTRLLDKAEGFLQFNSQNSVSEDKVRTDRNRDLSLFFHRTSGKAIPGLIGKEKRLLGKF